MNRQNDVHTRHQRQLLQYHLRIDAAIVYAARMLL
jgi:hypothetical protein